MEGVDVRTIACRGHCTHLLPEVPMDYALCHGSHTCYWCSRIVNRGAGLGDDAVPRKLCADGRSKRRQRGFGGRAAAALGAAQPAVGGGDGAGRGARNGDAAGGDDGALQAAGGAVLLGAGAETAEGGRAAAATATAEAAGRMEWAEAPAPLRFRAGCQRSSGLCARECAICWSGMVAHRCHTSALALALGSIERLLERSQLINP